VAAAVGLVVAYFAGVDDPAVVAAIGVIAGVVPAGITALVVARRK
jgi:hypothetical protein